MSTKSLEVAEVSREPGILGKVRLGLEGARCVAGQVASPGHAPLSVQCVSMVCYFGAASLMSRDDWFTGGTFVWHQSSILLVLGFLMVMAIAFEWHLLGVSRGFNFVVQLALAYPFTLFLARLLGRPWNYAGDTSLLGNAFSLASQAVDRFAGLSGMVPRWIQDAFGSPGTTLVLLFFCVVTAFCQSTQTRIAGVAAMMLIPLAVAFSQPPVPSRSFLAGTALMAFGATLQHRDVRKYYRDKEILERLRYVTDEYARRASLRLVSRAWSAGRVGERTAEGIVREAYQDVDGLEASDIRDITRTLVDDLVTTHSLLDIRHSTEGLFLVPPASADLQNDLLEQTARMPRVVIVFVLAVLWVCLPLDMVPDAVPIVGAMDDVVIMSLATAPLGQLLGRRVEAYRLR